MNFRRRVAAAVGITTAFMLSFFGLVVSYSFPESIPPSLMFLVNMHFEFMLFMVGLGVACGAGVFYLMREEVQVVQKESKLNAELALSLLSPDERKAVGKLVEKGGSCLQADVARMDGMSRLKAHRTARTLEKRGVVALERNGKAITIRLAANVKEALVP